MRYITKSISNEEMIKIIAKEMEKLVSEYGNVVNEYRDLVEKFK